MAFARKKNIQSTVEQSKLQKKKKKDSYGLILKLVGIILTV